MALNTCELWFNGIKIAFFAQKITKIVDWLGALPPDPKASGGWGPRPQTPACDTLS